MPALFGALAMAIALTAVPPAAAQQGVDPARAAGANRYDTAAEVAGLDHDTSRDVFIASGETFPDALAASFAAGTAGAEQGPILLSGQRDLTDPTRQALSDLAPERVFVVGGPRAIHPDVVAELEGRGYEQVVRVHGRDRYETAAAVALGWGTGPAGEVGVLDGDRTALLASGTVFPDALAAGPIAARSQFPLFLTPPDRPHAEVDRRLADLGIERIVVVGGDRAVSSGVVRHYQDQGFEVERWGGLTRMATAAVVADNAVERLGFAPSLTLLARGDTFPDALAASIHAALNRSPVLLTADPNLLGLETEEWLRARCPDVDVIRALGGPAAVSPATLDQAVAAAEECLDRQPHTEQSYIQSPQEVATAPPPHTFDVHVSGFDQPGNPAPVDIALFPCAAADPAGPDNTFGDANGDGFADGIGTTTTNSAVLASAHGEAVSPTRHLDDVPPNVHDHITYTIHSDAEDCTINVVFHDANSNDQLDVDDQGRPLEHWNYGQHVWDSDA